VVQASREDPKQVHACVFTVHARAQHLQGMRARMRVTEAETAFQAVHTLLGTRLHHPPPPLVCLLFVLSLRDFGLSVAEQAVSQRLAGRKASGSEPFCAPCAYSQQQACFGSGLAACSATLAWHYLRGCDDRRPLGLQIMGAQLVDHLSPHSHSTQKGKI
jgi:hypothetical protein